VLYGWANDILRHNATERSVIIVFMNLFAQSTTAWTGILVFPTVEAPRFLKGWTFCAVNSFVLILFTYAVIRPLARREERKYGVDEDSVRGGLEEEGSTGDQGSQKDLGRINVAPQVQP
jgi:hypothetical protein